MKLFLQRWWPFCWKSTLQAERTAALAREIDLVAAHRETAQKFSAEIEARRIAEQNAEDADRKMTVMQSTFDASMRRLHEPYGQYAASILRQVQERAFVRAYTTKVEVAFANHLPMPRQRNEQSISLVRIGFSAGLASDTPPELVAQDIADLVRAAILRQWREQSLLLNSPARRT